MPYYSRLQIILHWVVAALIVVQFVAHDGMEHAWRTFTQTGAKTLTLGAGVHVGAGIAVLLFAFVRLFLRRRSAGAANPADTDPAWMRVAAKAMHVSLYALMILVPISGMAAWGGEVTQAAEGHGILTKLLIALVVVHVGAAIYHQFVLKDNLMARMRPPQ